MWVQASCRYRSVFGHPAPVELGQGRVISDGPEDVPNMRASMGPQLYRCGDSIQDVWSDVVFALLQWGRNFIVAETYQNAGFKGEYHALQWGRNFIVAETTQTPPICFNGAATLSLRRSQVKVDANVRYHASMGPQLYRCGDWGEAMTRAAEYMTASMGPQLYRCGDRSIILVPNAGFMASMGPQLYRLRRRSAPSLARHLRSRLQWGRNFIVAETFATCAKCSSNALLQWGRNFIVAETIYY